MRHVFLFLFTSVIFFFACSSEDETLMGCTDSDASNYNAQATDNDGSCIYDRDAFFATYVADTDCGPHPTAEIEIRSSQKSNISVEVYFIFQQLTFEGTVNGNILTVNNSVPSNFPNLCEGGALNGGDMKFIASMELQNNGDLTVSQSTIEQKNAAGNLVCTRENCYSLFERK